MNIKGTAIKSFSNLGSVKFLIKYDILLGIRKGVSIEVSGSFRIITGLTLESR